MWIKSEKKKFSNHLFQHKHNNKGNLKRPINFNTPPTIHKATLIDIAPQGRQRASSFSGNERRNAARFSPIVLPSPNVLEEVANNEVQGNKSTRDRTTTEIETPRNKTRQSLTLTLKRTSLFTCWILSLLLIFWFNWNFLMKFFSKNFRLWTGRIRQIDWRCEANENSFLTKWT